MRLPHMPPLHVAVPARRSVLRSVASLYVSFVHGHSSWAIYRGQPRRLGLRTQVAVVDCTGQEAKFLSGLQLLLQLRVHLLVPLQRAKGRAGSGR